LLSTGLSTRWPQSCTEMINFSTVEAAGLWTLDRLDKGPDSESEAH
jgi:hypothetical protein